MRSAQSRAPYPSFFSLRQTVLWLQEFIKSSPGAGSVGNWVLLLQGEWHPANPSVRCQLPLSSRITHFNIHALSGWPNHKYFALGGKWRAGFLGQHRANLHLWKKWWERHHVRQTHGNGALHISAISLGFSALSVEWITIAAWWSSKPWTHFLVLSNGDTLRMWLIRESSSPRQTFSNGNRLTPRVKLLSW